MKLKQRRTRSQIEADKPRQEEEKTLLKEAKDLKRQVVALERKEQQDKSQIDELKQQNKKLKTEALGKSVSQMSDVPAYIPKPS